MNDLLHMAVAERLDDLVDGFAHGSRRARARDCIAAGAVDAFTVEPCRVSARVSGTETYETSLQAPQLPLEQWQHLAVHLAADDVSPDTIGALLELVPSRELVEPHCTCPDGPQGCKHLYALGVTFAAAVRRDADILIRWRGGDTKTLLEYAASR